MRVLELFAGIGGCSAALADRAQVVGAVDQNRYARQVYTHDFDTPVHAWNLATVKPEKLEAFDADLWWASPPCQPFTVRGKRLDVHDKRSAALIHLTGILESRGPRHFALENVPGFATSTMRRWLIEVLDEAGYHWRERTLCPTELGIPMRRARYYLIASRDPLRAWLPVRAHRRRVESYLRRPVDPALYLPPQMLDKYAGKLPISDPVDAPWVGVFTSAYGSSPVYAGSYWRDERGVRYFSPSEGLAFLGFPPRFTLPELDFRRSWKLVGNSLSVDAARVVLEPFTARWSAGIGAGAQSR